MVDNSETDVRQCDSVGPGSSHLAGDGFGIQKNSPSRIGIDVL